MNILLKAADGSIALMSLAEGADKEEAVRKFKESHPDENFGDYFEFQGELPLSREFRDAWIHNGKDVVVDNAKALLIHMKRIRHARNAALDLLDKEQLKQLPFPDKLREIESRKQILRDLPSNVKGLDWPDILERK